MNDIKTEEKPANTSGTPSSDRQKENCHVHLGTRYVHTTRTNVDRTVLTYNTHNISYTYIFYAKMKYSRAGVMICKKSDRYQSNRTKIPSSFRISIQKR